MFNKKELHLLYGSVDSRIYHIRETIYHKKLKNLPNEVNQIKQLEDTVAELEKLYFKIHNIQQEGAVK